MVSETLAAIAPTTQSGLIGVEPIDQIVMMENHDDAYYAWQKAGLRDRVLVHVDAHMDFGWIAERDPVDETALGTNNEDPLEGGARRPAWGNVLPGINGSPGG